MKKNRKRQRRSTKSRNLKQNNARNTNNDPNHVHVDVKAAFGPLIYEVTITPEKIKKINEACDKAIENAQSWNHRLVGNLAGEWLIPNDLLLEEELYHYFREIAEMYVKTSNGHLRSVSNNMMKNPNELIIQSAWVNEMKKYEYNPVHYHTNCVLSSVLFLKVPDFSSNPILNSKNKTDNKRESDGCLEFISHSYFPGTADNGNLMISPEVGKFYIFPAGLQHTVYPFGCEGIRRSMAINFQ